jgi:hypothetical protein
LRFFFAGAAVFAAGAAGAEASAGLAVTAFCSDIVNQPLTISLLAPLRVPLVLASMHRELPFSPL